VTDKIPAKFHDEISDFIRQCSVPLYRHLLLLTRRDHALADELVQQVRIEVALNWPKIRALDDSGRRGYAFRMAQWRAIDAFRKNETARDYESRVPAAHRPAETDPYVHAITAETVARLFSVIESLPRRQALVAVLYWAGQWKNAEIAEELGITPGAVTRLLGRARTRIVTEVGPSLLDDLRDPEGGA
jgi:RNA polymerase sigma factor (sigma-70 family)